MDKLLVQLRGTWNCPGCENAGHQHLYVGKLRERGQAVAERVASLVSCEALESVCSRQSAVRGCDIHPQVREPCNTRVLCPAACSLWDPSSNRFSWVVPMEGTSYV